MCINQPVYMLALSIMLLINMGIFLFGICDFNFGFLCKFFADLQFSIVLYCLEKLNLESFASSRVTVYSFNLDVQLNWHFGILNILTVHGPGPGTCHCTVKCA